MTTTWTIAQLDRELADGYVYTVHYRVDATDGTYSAGAYGSRWTRKTRNTCSL